MFNHCKHIQQMFRTPILIFILFLAGVTPTIGQRSIQAYPLPEPITIDGMHEPGRWEGADSAINFFQMEPVPGDEASEPTVCYIGYDSENLYISVNLYQEADVLAKVQEPGCALQRG